MHIRAIADLRASRLAGVWGRGRCRGAGRSYPVFFLLQAALDVGDPEARPPTAYGFDNFAGLLAISADPAQHADGVVRRDRDGAGVRLRDGVDPDAHQRAGPAHLFEQLMAVPYYLTPLLGALAWSLLGTPESGFINQVWRALGGNGYLIDINTPYGIAWVMALFEGSVAFVMIAAVMKSMDPALEEASQVMGASRLRTMLRDYPAAGAARRARRRDLRFRRNARLVRRRARARPAQPLLRDHHRDLPAGPAISAEDPGRGRDGRVAVRGDVRHAVPLPAHRHGGQLRHHHRQGVPAAGRPMSGGCVTCCSASACSICSPRSALPLVTLLYASMQKIAVAFPAAEQLDAGQLPRRHDDECRPLGARQQPAARASAPRRSASC